MNDRFKFRVWVEEEKRMVYFDLTHIMDGYIFDQGMSGEGTGYLTKWCLCNHGNTKVSEPMQSTSLKDKNGKLVFEGDIVKAVGKENKNIGVIKYSIKSAIFKVRFGLNMALPIYYVFPIWEEQGFEREIIGNIHENPDLLGGTNDL